MNNAQLDMVLGYINEGTEIDSTQYMIESMYEEYENTLLESNADINDTKKEYNSKLRKITREYNKAFKAKDKEELERLYKEYLSTVDDFEKEINDIKVTKGDTAKGAASAILFYGVVLFFLKSPHMPFKVIFGAANLSQAIQQIKKTVEEIKKNGLTAESLNIYKTNAKIIINGAREGIKRAHKKNLEKLEKENKK